MADNLTTNPGAGGADLATDEIAAAGKTKGNPMTTEAIEQVQATAAPTATESEPSSLIARGKEDAAPAAPAASVPEKYIVKNEDGTVNHEATALKVAEGYKHLEKRMGTGDAPPKSPDEYAPTVTAMSLDALKEDPKYTGFLKGAHARGMTNAQVGYVLDTYAAALAPNPELAEAELRKDWATDDQMTRGLQNAYRATAAYAKAPDLAERIDKKFGSDPDFIRLMANIGRELGEDSPPAGLSAAESDTLQSLIGHPAYYDAKHPEHGRIVAKATNLYNKKFGGQ